MIESYGAGEPEVFFKKIFYNDGLAMLCLFVWGMKFL